MSGVTALSSIGAGGMESSISSVWRGDLSPICHQQKNKGLRYARNPLFFRAGPTRLELATSGVTGQRSSQAPAVFRRFHAFSEATTRRPQSQGFTKGPIKKGVEWLEFHPTPSKTTMLDMMVAYPSRCRQVQIFSLSPDCELSEDSGIREVHHG